MNCTETDVYLHFLLDMYQSWDSHSFKAWEYYTANLVCFTLVSHETELTQTIENKEGFEKFQQAPSDKTVNQK